MANRKAVKTPFWSTSVRPQFVYALVATVLFAVGFALGFAVAQ